MKSTENTVAKESNTTQKTNTSTKTTALAPKTGLNTNTFRSIFNQAGSHVCTYEQLSASSRTNGSIYIADGKMRAEFRTVNGNGTISNLMVYNGGTLYAWREGSTMGTKSQLTSVSGLPFIIPQDLTSGGTLGSGSDTVSWDCHDWSKNNSLLSPPSYVKFN